MILADKIMEQRKKLGLSQEELADRLGVSRQAVSKWESAQSTPDLGRILSLAQVFGVSTDYLLKDEVEQTEYVETPNEDAKLKRVSMAEANAFLAFKFEQARKIALATLLCILSPVCLLLLGALSEAGTYGVSENAAGGIGMIVLLLFVGAAVAIFISSGSKGQPYEYLSKEDFDTEYGVIGMVKERQTQYQPTHTRKTIFGVCACIASAIPLFVAAFTAQNDFVVVAMVPVLLLIAGIGVYALVSSAICAESMQKLLQEGDYTKKNKKNAALVEAVSCAYWLAATAIYLAYSFSTDDWDKTWIVWPVAGVLFGAVSAVLGVVTRNRTNSANQ